MNSQGNNNLDLLVQYGAKIMLNMVGQCHSVVKKLNEHSQSQDFMIQSNVLSSVENLRAFLGETTLDGLSCQAIVEKQGKQALIQGQRNLFSRVNSDFSRLRGIDLKSVIGVGINGTSNQGCFLELRKHNISKSYKLSIADSNIQMEDQILSDVILTLILSLVTQSSQDEIIKSYPNVNILSSTKQIMITQNESILLPSMFVNPPLKNVSIFSGSFNPFHVGHYEMYNESLSHPLLKNTPLVFELTTKNADKEANNNIEERIKSIVSFFNKQEQSYKDRQDSLEQESQCIISQLLHHNIQVLISSKGLFIQKQLHEGCFVIGADTYIRLFDLKFYQNSPTKLKKTVAKFISDDARFLVFNRKNKESQQFQQIVDHGVEYGVVQNWCNDISSTIIRQQTGK